MERPSFVPVLGTNVPVYYVADDHHKLDGGDFGTCTFEPGETAIYIHETLTGLDLRRTLFHERYELALWILGLRHDPDDTAELFVRVAELIAFEGD